MYLAACGALLALALILNWRSARMLALTFLVGVSIFVPVPRMTAEVFYTFCIVMEIAVAAAAWALDDDSSAGEWMALICVLLVITHIFGYVQDGSGPFSPYRMIVKILEVSQLVACVVLSPIAAPLLRNRDATTS